jgi:hypothetical protein
MERRAEEVRELRELRERLRIVEILILTGAVRRLLQREELTQVRIFEQKNKTTVFEFDLSNTGTLHCDVVVSGSAPISARPHFAVEFQR